MLLPGVGNERFRFHAEPLLMCPVSSLEVNFYGHPFETGIYNGHSDSLGLAGRDSVIQQLII